MTIKDKTLSSYHQIKDMLKDKQTGGIDRQQEAYFLTFSSPHGQKVLIDMLIDLTLGDFAPLMFAGALSKAHFKVGRYSERNAKYYDLMIHAEQVETLPEFIKHVRHYISKVNR